MCGYPCSGVHEYFPNTLESTAEKSVPNVFNTGMDLLPDSFSRASLRIEV
jgi:hypothetical protein